MDEPTNEQMSRAMYALMMSAQSPDGLAGGRSVYAVPADEPNVVKMFFCWVYFVGTRDLDDLPERNKEWRLILQWIAQHRFSWEALVAGLENEDPVRAVIPYKD